MRSNLGRSSSPRSLRLLLLLFIAVVFLSQCLFGQNINEQFDEDKFRRVVTKLETDIVQLARQVEDLYVSRCRNETLHSCAYANYDHCHSALATPTCSRHETLYSPICGNSTACSSRHDANISSVRIVESVFEIEFPNAENNAAVIESMCYTRPLDDWFRQKYVNDSEFWTHDIGYNVEGASSSIASDTLNGGLVPLSYFGSTTGLFRAFPARPSEKCAYDPRSRPWYKSASPAHASPKNVVLVLDVSGSLTKRTLQDIKWAARHVVYDTLTDRDHVAIVVFESNARLVDSVNRAYRVLVPATDANKQHLMDCLQNVTIGERTNYYDAFNLTFDVLDRSIEQDNGRMYAPCHTVILFVTGSRTVDLPINVTEDQVLDLVKVRMNATQDLIGRNSDDDDGVDKSIQLFTFSIGDNVDDIVHAFPRRLACEVGRGVWSQIRSTDNFKNVLSSYLDLFTFGLLPGGGDTNETTNPLWTKPYNFSTGGFRGTTVAMPVFDRFTHPDRPLFLGVVGIDMALDPLITALGGTVGEYNVELKVFEYIEDKRGGSTCQALALDDCELQAYRRSKDFSCPNVENSSLSCPDVIRVQQKPCVGVELPRVVWNNLNNSNGGPRLLDYKSRVCCGINDSSSNFCQAPRVNLTIPTISIQTNPPDNALSTTPSPTTADSSSAPRSSRRRGPSFTTYFAITSIVLVFVATVLCFVRFARSHGRRNGQLY